MGQHMWRRQLQLDDAKVAAGKLNAGVLWHHDAACCTRQSAWTRGQRSVHHLLAALHNDKQNAQLSCHWQQRRLCQACLPPSRCETVLAFLQQAWNFLVSRDSKARGVSIFRIFQKMPSGWHEQSADISITSISSTALPLRDWHVNVEFLPVVHDQ